MMEDNKIQLEEKFVGEIAGNFYIPSYQRGYRWDETQVKDLLNDIYENGDHPYCLQPIVVRKDPEGRYELIDGQQRLTTLYIIYKFMRTIFPVVDIKYTLTYQTRSKCEEFFNNMDDDILAETNIDFFFIHKAFRTVKEWFDEKGQTQSIYIVTDFLKRFDNSVRVIWYELQGGTTEDAIALFTRLNIGRIPLTNAELVKALFLCERKDEDGNPLINEQRQLEISLQWDRIEQEMQDDNFWYFLTRNKAEDYPTRIELLFDFIAGKSEDTKDPFFTFLHFNQFRDDLKSQWERILRNYHLIREWYRNDHLYHKIGYLIASGSTTIDILIAETRDMRKSEMEEYLNDRIKQSIKSRKPYDELTYQNDYDLITKILLLFNVISLMRTGSDTRFPFKAFNHTGNDTWSLEHIHAQHSLNLNTQEQWKEWLRLHRESLISLKKNIGENELANEIDHLNEEILNAIENPRLRDATFNDLADKVIAILSQKTESTEYVHSISNMALLQKSKNSELNNSLFDVKRKRILEMDASGQYIPYCTKMVFLKYYSSEVQDSISFHFWGENDRKAYIAKINEILQPYLSEEING